MKNEQKGITLIALIITVIILLILAGTAISIAINGDSLFSKASQAKTEWNSKVSEENLTLNNFIGYIDQYQSTTGTTTGGDEQQSGVSLPTEIATKVASNQDLTGITITLPTISGHYSWDADYCSDTDTITANVYDPSEDTYVDKTVDSDIELYTGTTPTGITAYTTGSASDSSNYDMTISSWKILKVNSDNTIDLIPAEQSKPEVPLNGIQGYNNGVNLLNAACSALYGDESKGIIARSIKIEDIEEIAGESTITSRKNSSTTYGSSATYNGTYSKTFPAIYAEETGATIDGNTVTDGLGQSATRGSLIARTGTETATTSVQLTSNCYYIKFNSTNFGNYANLLKAKSNPGSTKQEKYDRYWIASRCIQADTCATYGFFVGTEGGISTHSTFLAIADGAYAAWYSLFPVVTLQSGSLESTATENTYMFVPET